MTKIVPVLLAGGVGERLWPLSRKSYPKQFSKFLTEESLFQAAAKRLSNSSGFEFELPITVTNADYRFIVAEQLLEIEIDPGAILIEPEAKNTAPAILAATLFALSRDPEAIIFVAPSDHSIPDIENFHEAISKGLSEVFKGRIVTFGIKPSHPDTGLGYLEVSESRQEQVFSLRSFVEKPTLVKAQDFVDSGNYLWNAGMFLFRGKDIISAFERYCNYLMEPVSNALHKAKTDLGFLRLDPEAWSECVNISIDYAIMEHMKDLSVVRYGGHWSDLGNWESIWREGLDDGNGVVCSENATALDCENTLLRSESPSQYIVGIGLKDIIAVAMPDGVLVSDMSKAQEVGRAVAILKLKGSPQGEIFPRDYRPWGFFESLIKSDMFQVKKISVNVGASLSLQSHKFRSEHWVVVEGCARVTIKEEIKIINQNQGVYIPLGAKHRLENGGKTTLILIEVQSGSYFGEDDITRYDDVYKRD